MDLATFVSDTLESIVDGTERAEARLAERGSRAVVSPRLVPLRQGSSTRAVLALWSRRRGHASPGVEMVEFEISLDAPDARECRLRFSVPVQLPLSDRRESPGAPDGSTG